MQYSVEIISIGVFLGTIALFYFLSKSFDREGRRTEARVRELTNERKAGEQGTWDWLSENLSSLGQMLVDLQAGSQLRERLQQAGYSDRIGKAASIFRASQLVLSVVLGTVGGAIPWVFGWLTGVQAFAALLAGCSLGFIIPGVVLDYLTKRRLSEIRQAWPDAMDMMVLCLEGGLSLAGTLDRVCEEMEFVHPTLGAELIRFQAEMRLGQGAGEAMMNVGERNGVDEIRDLATIILQSEDYGVSITKAIRLHSDSCRVERHMKAEEQAQKAAVKILFPTLFCIFPAIFIVILGPAAYQIAEMFSGK